MISGNEQAYYKAIKGYIANNLHKIFKPAGGRFRFPFIDPGSIYEGNLWDWDSFWTVYALIAFSGTDGAGGGARDGAGDGDGGEARDGARDGDGGGARNGAGVGAGGGARDGAGVGDGTGVGVEPGFAANLAEHAMGGVRNFLAFQLEDGYIPMMAGGRADEEGGNCCGDGNSSSGSGNSNSGGSSVSSGSGGSGGSGGSSNGGGSGSGVSGSSSGVSGSNLAPLDSYLIRKHKEGAVLNMHKPFLCRQALMISGFTGSFAWLGEHLGSLERYFGCYDRLYFNDRCGLYVWADDVMIGADNDPAIFGRPRYSTAAVFLNAFMVCELRAMGQILDAFGKTEEAMAYRAKSEKLTAALQSECWDSRDRFYYSADVDVRTRPYDWFHKGLGVFWKTLPIKVRSWSGFIPLYARIATAEQAEDIVRRHACDAKTFRSAFGIRSLSRDEKMYNVEATNNPSNWLGPVWLVTNYVVFRGMMNYGYRREAEALCADTLALLGKDLAESGDLHEYYDPETGKPVMSPGFLNWNMLVVNMVEELEGRCGPFDAIDFPIV